MQPTRNFRGNGSPQPGISIIALVFFCLFVPGMLRAQWNPNTYINLLISGLQDADQQSASTTDAKTWIAFFSPNGSNYDMRAQLIDANGVKLLGANGVLVSNQTSGSATYVFNVCVDASNNLIIACQDMRSGSNTAVVYKISQTGTQLWSSTGVVLGAGLSPYPAVLSNGDVVVAWNETNSNTLQIQKITTGGTLAWGTPVAVLVGTTTTTRGQLIAGTSGKFTMVYQKRGVGISTTLYAQQYDASGTALYGPLQISNQTSSGARYYSIAAEGDTTFFGYYVSSGSRFNSFLQRINPGGAIPWGMNGSNFNTSTGSSDSYQGVTNINMAPGSNFVWSVCTFSNPAQTLYGVYIQKFLKTTGARQFTDAAKVVYAISANTDQQSGNMSLVNDTPMFMSYDVNDKIYATRLNASGDFVWPGNRVELSSTTATLSTPKMRFGFTPDGPSRCAGTWTENRGTAYMGYAQGISIGGLLGIIVMTQGNVPATITTNGGTLQMIDSIFPSTANQSATWSIVPGTGSATISAGGLVTAVSNGTVYAKAAAMQDASMQDSLLITISGQAAALPSVITLAATAVTGISATLNGSVNANGASTAVSFNWGLTVAYGNTLTATPSTVTGNSPTAVIANLTGLLPGTTYHFRAVGVNIMGTAYGSDLTFTTPFILEVVVTNQASNIGLTTAQLNGTVTANNVSTTVTFDWGTTISYGNNMAATPGTVNGMTPTAVIANLSGLITGTTYHFRCKGVNSVGTVYGSDMTFVAGCITPSAPGTISGPASVCQGQTGVIYSVAPIANATNYNWTVPTGGSIVAGSGTNTITVNFSAVALSGNVTVTGTNSCAAGPTGTLAVAVHPQPTPTITGQNSTCAGSGTNYYSTESGMSGYVWTVTAGGTISSGQGTDNVQVIWNAAGTQTITVNYANSNGCSAATPTSYGVTVNDVPAAAGSITGLNAVCAGTQGVAYSCAPIPGAGFYVWTLPSGVAIATGAGTDTITVNYSANAASGNITVYGNNLCGNGAASPPLMVTVTVSPPAPVVTASGDTLTSSAPTGNQWYFSDTQTGTGSAIPGATGQTWIATQVGWYWSILNPGNCSSDPSGRVHVLTVGMLQLQPAYIAIHPVPCDGKFTITIHCSVPDSFTLSVFNPLGSMISQVTGIEVRGAVDQIIDLRPAASGLYTIIIRGSIAYAVKKVLVQP